MGLLCFVAFGCGSVEEPSNPPTSTVTSGAGGAGGSGAGGSTSTGGSGGSSTGGSLPPCEESMNGDHHSFDCEIGYACSPRFHGKDFVVPTFPDSTPVDTFEDPEDARCALKLLRDRTAGRIALTNSGGGIYGQFALRHTIWVLPTAHAEVEIVEAADLSSSGELRHRQILKPASYFEACLTKSDSEMYACLTDIADGCDDVPSVCPEP